MFEILVCWRLNCFGGLSVLDFEMCWRLNCVGGCTVLEVGL